MIRSSKGSPYLIDFAGRLEDSACIEKQGVRACKIIGL